MSVNYNLNVRNARLQVVETAIDAGGAAGALRLLNSGGTTLSSLSLAFPAGTVSGGVLTFFTSLIDLSAAQTGTAVGASVVDSIGTVVISGLTVGSTLGFDIILSPNANITAGQVVAITQATITGN